MNKIYKITRNRTTGQTVVASELAKGNKKSLTGRLLALSVGAIALTGTVSFAHAAPSSNQINVDTNNQKVSSRNDTQVLGDLTINFADPNYTLIFQAPPCNDYGAAIDASGGLTLQVGGNNTPGGNLVFQSNYTTATAVYGGAIYIKSSSLDLSTLNSILFSGNIAGNSSDGRGGDFFFFC